MFLRVGKSREDPQPGGTGQCNREKTVPQVTFAHALKEINQHLDLDQEASDTSSQSRVLHVLP